MKKKSSPSLNPFLRLFCVLIIVLIQLPTISLGFDFKTISSPNINLFPATSALNNPALTNNAMLVVFSNPASISITDRASGAGTPNGISSPYPSVINVTGLSGTVSDVNVTITGITANRERDLNFALVAPTGQALMLLGDGGDLAGLASVNLTFDDSAPSLVSNTVITSGTYRPTDYVFSANDSDVFPSPGPASVNNPAPEGAATLASTFNGLSPNGNWSLYIIDDSNGGGTSTVTGGWSIDITTAGATTPTTTSVTSSLNPANVTQTITFTSTTVQVPSGTPVNAGTVAFTNNGVTISGCGAVAVNASGVATCSTTSAQGARNIVATYSGTASFGTSSGSLTQTVNSPTVVSGSQFCNNGGILLPDSGTADVYPANVVVSGLVGTISKVTTQINGLTAPRPSNIDALLVGPTSAAFEIMSDAGDAVSPVTNINLSLDDAAASALPNGSALTGGTFRPSDYDNLNTDTFPAPAPASFNRPSTGGAATFASVYNGSNPNGTWSFYILDDGAGGGASSIGGVCVTFALNKFNTTTTLTTSQNPINQGNSVTFTATVTAPSGGGTIPSGSVQFFDGATSLGIVALNGQGRASLTTSALLTGNHNISAQYLGANVGAGGGGFNASTSNTIVQVVNIPTASNAFVEGRVLTASGSGVMGAIVRIVDSSGIARSATTSTFGYYRFEDVRVGETYVLNASAKGRTFNTRIISVNEDIADQDFVEEAP